jgi:predicted DNA-binding protein
MKIEINLQDIFVDDEGTDVQQAIKDAILEEASQKITSAVARKIEEKVAEIVSNVGKTVSVSIKEKVDAHLAKILPSFLDYEFTEVTSWGEKKATYTVRNRILKALEDNTKYEPRASRYDQNAFTTMIHELVARHFEGFKKSYSTLIDQTFTASALEYAQAELKKKLGVSA